MPLRLPTLWRPSWTVVAISVVAAGLVHIIATLAVPFVAKSSAFRRLERDLPANEMRLLSLATPAEQAFPFMAPDTRYAVCRFDISEAAVTVTAELAERGWSITLYSDQGDGFYSVAAPDQKASTIGFTIQPAPEPMYGFIPATRSVAVEASTVMSPYRKGLVVIRAPIRSPTFAPAVLASLSKASCQARAR